MYSEYSSDESTGNSEYSGYSSNEDEDPGYESHPDAGNIIKSINQVDSHGSSIAKKSYIWANVDSHSGKAL